MGELPKLRAGVGTSGNESILTGGNYSLTTYGTATGAHYYFGGAFDKGVVQLQKGNKDPKWETDVTVNVGLDFSLLNDRLSGSFDYYVRTARTCSTSRRCQVPMSLHAMQRTSVPHEAPVSSSH